MDANPADEKRGTGCRICSSVGIILSTDTESQRKTFGGVVKFPGVDDSSSMGFRLGKNAVFIHTCRVIGAIIGIGEVRPTVRRIKPIPGNVRALTPLSYRSKDSIRTVNIR